MFDILSTIHHDSYLVIPKFGSVFEKCKSYTKGGGFYMNLFSYGKLTFCFNIFSAVQNNRAYSQGRKYFTYR